MEKISVVVPCYNEEKALPLFYEELKKNMKDFARNVEFEVLFFFYGSKDNTLKIILGPESKQLKKYIDDLK